MWVMHNTQELQAPIIAGGDGAREEHARRRPFEFISNIFKRRKDNDDDGDDSSSSGSRQPSQRTQSPNPPQRSGGQNNPSLSPSSATLQPHPPTTVPHSPHTHHSHSPSLARIATPSSPSPHPPSPLDLLTSSPNLVTSLGGGGALVPSHTTPSHSRDDWEAMEAIRLSRQDNPYLQRVAGSETSLTDPEEAPPGSGAPDEDRAQLVGRVGDQDGLSLSEVHEHLIRSPPPTTLPKGVPVGVFVFPTEDTNDFKCGSLPGSRALSLNPLVSRGHEDVLDLGLRQILDTQKHLTLHSGDSPTPGSTGLSSSVPGSPARSGLHGTTQGRGNRSPNPPHPRGEEGAGGQPTAGGNMVSSMNGSLGSFLSSSSGHYNMSFNPLSSSTNLAAGGVLSTSVSPSGAGGTLAPVLLPGRRQSQQRDQIGGDEAFAGGLRPLAPRPKRSISSSRSEISSVSAAMVSSSSALTLPIRCPNAPAAPNNSGVASHFASSVPSSNLSGPLGPGGAAVPPSGALLNAGATLNSGVGTNGTSLSTAAPSGISLTTSSSGLLLTAAPPTRAPIKKLSAPSPGPNLPKTRPVGAPTSSSVAKMQTGSAGSSGTAPALSL